MSRGGGRPTTIGDGLRHLIDAPKFALDKAPVLHAVFERFCSAIAEGMRQYCATPCAFMMNGIAAGHAGDLLAACQNDFGAIFHSPEWDARTVIGCDRRFAFAIIEAMYGADGTEPPHESDRQLTALEIRVMREIAATTAQLLREQLAPICQTSFVFERTETTLDSSTIGMSDAPAIMAQFESRIMNGGGRLFVLIPNAALLPFRKRLERPEPADTQTVDPVWAQTMQRELNRTQVEITATLEGPQMTLAALSQLRAGQIIALNSSAHAPMALEVEDQVLFMAKLGQAKGVFTVCIERRLDERAELLSQILGGANS